jgi:hypothetical protein
MTGAVAVRLGVVGLRRRLVGRGKLALVMVMLAFVVVALVMLALMVLLPDSRTAVWGRIRGKEVVGVSDGNDGR